VPWLRYVPTVSRPWDNPGWTGEVGRAEDVIRKYLDQWGLSGSDTTAYLCGHPKMIELGIGILKRRGFSNTAIRSEVYWVPEKWAPDEATHSGARRRPVDWFEPRGGAKDLGPRPRSDQWRCRWCAAALRHGLYFHRRPHPRRSLRRAPQR